MNYHQPSSKTSASDSDELELSSPREKHPQIDQIILGYVSGTDAQSRPLVSFVYAGQKYQVPALVTGAVSSKVKARQVALSFVGGDLHSPIILGEVYSPLSDMLSNMEIAEKPFSDREQTEDDADTLQGQPVIVDGQRVVIEGSEQVQLKCGDASITLTKAGKILIRGKYLLNRASGVNRIVGGSVQVN